MAINYLANINLNGNEIRNAVLHPLAADPEGGKLGQVYYNSAQKVLKIYDGEAWKAVGGTTVDGGSKSLEEILADYLKKDELPDIPSKKELTITAGQTSAQETIEEGQTLLAVLAKDATTNEIVMVDITVEKTTVTAKIAAAYEHDIAVTLTVI